MGSRSKLQVRSSQSDSIADVRDRLGFYGPTYISAKAATIAPSYFVRGLPIDEEEAARTRTSTKIGAVLDLITLRMRRDELNDVPNDKKAKFVVHCDSREIEPIFLYVGNLLPLFENG
jgi:hypothetical protein